MNYKFCTKNLRMKMRIKMRIKMRMRIRMKINKNFFFFNNIIKMSYYQFNRPKILQKAKEKYSKEKAAEYYLKIKEVIK